MAIAVYAGSYDPLTDGHVSVLRQAAKLFSHVRVLVAVNPAKKTVFTPDQRVDIISVVTRSMPNVSVDFTDRYVVEYAHDISATFLVRGIRSATDAQFELELANENKKLAPDITTLFLPADKNLAHISSSALKEQFLSGGDISQMCHRYVADQIYKALANERYKRKALEDGK